MKIAITTAFFMTGTGYQEENMAKVLTEMGHQVKVFTSVNYSPGYSHLKRQKYPSGSFKTEEGYHVERLKTIVKAGTINICPGLKKKVALFNPDVLLIIGIGTLFSYSLTAKNINANRYVFFGDNSDMLHRQQKKNWKQKIKHLINKRSYNRAVKNCEHLVLYTASTERILRKIISKKLYPPLNDKKINSSLGYDSSVFYFDLGEREKWRNNYHITPTDFVLITATKVQESKHIDKIIEAVDNLHQKGWKIYYMIVGLLNDDYGQIIKKLIQQTKHPDLFLFKDYVTQEEMRAYYSMADAGIWLQAAISIQQAMGTGLPVFLRNKDSVNHLLTPGTNGMFVELNNPESSLELYLNDHIQKTEDQKYDQRKTIIDFNKKFDYKNILNGILKGN